MRILYADVNIKYINPTANLAPALMRTISPNITFFGPGFVSEEVIKLGLQKWCETTGPYDVLIVGNWTPIIVDEFESSIDRMGIFLKKYAVTTFKAHLAKTYIQDIQKNLPNIEVPTKIYYGLAYDYFATSERQIEKIEKNNLYLISPNHQFSQKLEELPSYAKLEPYYEKKITQNRISNTWYDFVSNNPQKIITATHFIAPDEFHFTALAERKHLVSVPGALYHLRKEAIKALNSKGYSNARFSIYNNIYRIASRLGVNVYGRPIPLKLYNFLFSETLSNSKFIYTARGSFGTPVRKFFEIPAAGAFLICVPCSGYDELGFVDNKHYIHATPNDVCDVIQEFTSKPDEAQDIAHAGSKLVAQSHSLNARANQISSCLKQIIKGNYLGSHWDKGTYIVDKNEKSFES